MLETKLVIAYRLCKKQLIKIYERFKKFDGLINVIWWIQELVE